METIHTNCYEATVLKELYDLTLKDDPKFHFFWEHYLIIRISIPECRDKVVKYLTEKEYTYRIYDYPTPKTKGDSKGFDDWGNHGEDTLVLKYIDNFISLFHLHSIAALTMSGEDHHMYQDRVIHTMYNMRGIFGYEEADHLERMSKGRRKYQHNLDYGK